MKLPFELIKEKFGDIFLTAAEIGIYCADNAREYTKELNFKKLFLIDPFPSKDESEICGYTSDQWYPKVVEMFKDNSAIEIVKKTSEEATKIIDEKFDFVYIDGNHSYENVKQDIELWYPKTKVGGFFGGHDWLLSDVKKAVTEIFKKYEIGFEFDNSRSGEWWVWKIKEF